MIRYFELHIILSTLIIAPQLYMLLFLLQLWQEVAICTTVQKIGKHCKLKQ